MEGYVPQADCTMGYMDDNGHGTHVAGMIGAVNNDIGSFGIAPIPNYLPLRHWTVQAVGPRPPYYQGSSGQ